MRNNTDCKDQIHPFDETLDLPSDINLPFFAYGIFKPGQLAYSRIKSYVKKYEKTEINFNMLIRDGVPILADKSHHHGTKGVLIYFNENDKEEAYETISGTEPKNLYKWEEEYIGSERINVLVGVCPRFGSSCLDYGSEYDGRKDPYFKEAIKLIEENLKNHKSRGMDIKPFFNLQMNYMLLWAAIERYTKIKYGKKLGENNKKLSEEKIFQESLKEHVDNNIREHVYSAEDLRKYYLNPENPFYSIKYYYTLRCNVVHRGKAVIHDEQKIERALTELLAIFKDVLDDTFK